MDGMKRESRKRGSKGCAIIFLGRVWREIEECRWRKERIVWAKGKVGIAQFVWVCVCMSQ